MQAGTKTPGIKSLFLPSPPPPAPPHPSPPGLMQMIYKAPVTGKELMSPPSVLGLPQPPTADDPGLGYMVLVPPGGRRAVPHLPLPAPRWPAVRQKRATATPQGTKGPGSPPLGRAAREDASPHRPGHRAHCARASCEPHRFLSMKR